MRSRSVHGLQEGEDSVAGHGTGILVRNTVGHRDDCGAVGRKDRMRPLTPRERKRRAVGIRAARVAGDAGVGPIQAVFREGVSEVGGRIIADWLHVMKQRVEPARSVEVHGRVFGAGRPELWE